MTAPLQDVSSEQVITRYNELMKEEDELNRRYELKEQEELTALEAASREIEEAIREERETLVKGLPVDMAFPESFDKFLVQKRADQIRKWREEYETKKMERKKLHDAEKLKHAEKWKSVLFSTLAGAASSTSNLDLSVPEPRPKMSIPPQPHAYPARPVDVTGVLRQQADVPTVHIVPSQPSQDTGIVFPQLLPRPPVIPPKQCGYTSHYQPSKAFRVPLPQPQLLGQPASGEATERDEDERGGDDPREGEDTEQRRASG